MAKTLVQRYEAIVRLIKICSAFCEKDWPNILQVLCCLGSAMQGYCKLLNAIGNKDNIRYLTDELREIYRKYDLKHTDYRCCLQKSINTVNRFIKCMAIIHFSITMSLIAVVPFHRVVFNERIFVMQFLLPGIDPNTAYGYLVMNCMHCICILFGSFGNFAADLCFFTIVSHVPLFKDLLRCKCQDLNDILEGGKDVEQEGIGDCQILLKDIFQWHQKYMIYITTVKDNYFWVLIIEMGTVALSLASTLFCLILGTWPGGLTYLAYCLMMLYIYCGLGTLVEVTNDGFIDSGYTDVIWYKLPMVERKMIQMMVMMAQNTGGLTIGSVVPLTMNTGLQLTKAIYTMTMMLIIFLNKRHQKVSVKIRLIFFFKG
ncbi:odorant receptor 67d-like isoform X2 [Musca domestica]|uniref:Odorant receptor n=1 Tax=Musca domestica TaxID=7370 RepID=A0ABM3V250_MUSDO|nr:odorant receptor 67d-like isoform X2 [Musca domestica]